jgi:multidrug efflux system membrane fusion protein
MRVKGLVLVSVFVASGCRHEVAPKPIPAVRVERVTSGTTASGKVAYSAVAQPTTTTTLAFHGPGYVVQMMNVATADGRSRAVGEGDRVRRGDVIARLRDSEYRDRVDQATARVAAARAAAERARLEFERATRLYATQSVTKPEMETATAASRAAQAEVEAAQGGLEEARVALRDTALTVPVDGEVIKKGIELGTYVSPGTPAFVVGDVSRIKVVLGVPDVAVTKVQLGQPVTVTTDALAGRSFTARVSRIASAADPVTRNFDVEVELANADRQWKPGMIASVELGSVAPGEAHPMLPLTAFVGGAGRGDGFGVMVIEGDDSNAHAKLRTVALGEVLGNRVQVARGLGAGERVVVQGASMVKDGERVEVLPTEEP